MTFTINQMVDESKKYEEDFSVILETVQKELSLFNTPLKFNVLKGPLNRNTQLYYVKSGLLPNELLGVWKYAVLHMHLNITMWVNEDEQRIVAVPEFRYGHRTGGTNGTSIAADGASKIRIVYSLKDKTISVEHDKSLLFGLLRNIRFQLPLLNIPEEVSKSEEYIKYLDFRLSPEITEEENNTLISLLNYYKENLSKWSTEDHFALNEINEFIYEIEGWLNDLK